MSKSSNLAASRPRTKPASERREDLLTAGETLFLRHGLAATTVEQITNEAAVAKGTFYLHFATKERLLEALGERFSTRILAAIKCAETQSGTLSWERRLSAWARDYAKAFAENIALHDLAFLNHQARSRRGAVDNVLVDDLVGLLEQGNAAGAWIIDDVRETAVFMFGGLHALVDDARDGRGLRLPLIDRLCSSLVSPASHRDGDAG